MTQLELFDNLPVQYAPEQENSETDETEVDT